MLAYDFFGGSGERGNLFVHMIQGELFLLAQPRVGRFRKLTMQAGAG